MIPNDPYPKWPYLSPTCVGEYFGVPAQRVNHWLDELGLRIGGAPIEKAKALDMARLVTPETGQKSFWTWEKDRVIQVLVEVGKHPLLPVFVDAGNPTVDPVIPMPSSTPAQLVGPFTVQSNEGSGGHEIVDANGVVGVWVRGEKNAASVLAVMNAGHRCGKFGGPPPRT